VVTGKRSLGEKKSENEMVMTELSLVDEDNSTIYKLVGPVLAKQDHGEAKTSVKARLDYITKEIDRMEHLEKEFIGNVEDKKKTIMRLQNEFRAEAQRMQAAAQGQAPQ
jgi:prefoldin beta subunit